MLHVKLRLYFLLIFKIQKIEKPQLFQMILPEFMNSTRFKLIKS